MKKLGAGASMSGPRVWHRLGILQAARLTDDQRLDHLIAVLRSDNPLTNDQRKEAASFLSRLRDNVSIMRAVTAGRGRPRGSPAPDIALDYLAQKQLLGKAEAAKKAVAEAWSEVLGRQVSEATVKDAFTDWKHAAQWQLSSLIDRRIGKIRSEWSDGRPTEYWTKEELLEAVSLDLRDHYRSKPKRSRKNSP